MPRAAPRDRQACGYFWGEDVVRMAAPEQLEGLRTRDFLTMAVAPEETGLFRGLVERMGFAVEPAGRVLMAHRP